MYLFVLGKEHFLCQGLFCVCGIAAEGIFIRKPQETAGEVAEKGTGASRETAGEIASCNRAGETKEEQRWNSTKWIS